MTSAPTPGNQRLSANDDNVVRRTNCEIVAKGGPLAVQSYVCEGPGFGLAHADLLLPPPSLVLHGGFDVLVPVEI